MVSLRSKVSQKILNYFMLQQGAEAYVNGLARLLGVESGNLTRKLIALEKEGLLRSRWQGQERYYSLNKSFPLLKEYKNIVLKTIGLDQTLKASLSGLSGLKKAIIFGSYAQGKMDSHSDIDLLVIGDHSTIELQKVVAQVQKSIQRDINVVSMSVQEYNDKKGKDAFLKSIDSKKTIKVI